jgi:hypothetical protein
VQKIGIKYLFHKKLMLNQCLGLCTPQKTQFYACFMPQNRPMTEKCGLTVYSISHGRIIFVHIQVGGQGRSKSGGKAAVSTKQGENLFTAKMRPLIHQLLAPQTSVHFLPEVKDVAFHM